MHHLVCTLTGLPEERGSQQGNFDRQKHHVSKTEKTSELQEALRKPFIYCQRGAGGEAGTFSACGFSERASSMASSESNTRAGPSKRVPSFPVIFPTQPSGARFPYSICAHITLFTLPAKSESFRHTSFPRTTLSAPRHPRHVTDDLAFVPADADIGMLQSAGILGY